MKILYLSDNLDHWSCHNRCLALQRFLPQHKIDIKQGWGKERAYAILYGEYDIIHVHYMNRMHEFYPLMNEMGAKFLFTLANERSLLTGYGIEVDKVEKMIVDFPCYFTSLTPKLAKKYNVPYIPNGVDLEMFHSPRRAVIGYAGTQRDNKGYYELVEACEKMGADLIRFCYKDGQVPQEEMWKEYKRMDCLIHPSKTEGCNNVVLEALAMNVPVYMTREGIWEDLQDYVTFIEPTVESICEVIRKYQGRDLISNSFTWEQIAEKYDAIYHRIFNGS